jgi:DNA end-binding protein Ku
VALTERINAKRQGKNSWEEAEPERQERCGSDGCPEEEPPTDAPKGKKPRKAAAGQKEMLLAIEGKSPQLKRRPSRSVLPDAGRPAKLRR